MTVIRIAAASLLLISLTALSSASDKEAAPKPTDNMPRLAVPKGWRTEDTTYPPPWARQLPWRGRLQLRFAPGFFKPDSDFFWSYPIFYWLEGDVLNSDKQLATALRSYDAGLYGGKFAKSKIQITMGKPREVKKGQLAVTRRSVQFAGFDPFATKKPLATHMEIFRWHCADSNHTGVLILRSARKFDEKDPVWKKLLSFQESIR